MASLEQCVADKIPTLLREGMDRDQAVAAAFSMCSQKAREAGLEVKAWDELTNVQRGWWIGTMAHVKADEISAQYTWNVGDGTIISNAPSTVIKRLGEDRVGGYGMVWGNAQQRDIEGQWFTPNTYLGKTLGVPKDTLGRTIKTNIDWLFEHTLEDLPKDGNQFDDMRDYTLGVIDTTKADDIGVWIEAQVDRHDEWANAVMKLIDRGILLWSSGSAPLYAKVAPDGEIKAWPIVEWSSTSTPAEFRHTQNVRLKHYVNDQDAPIEALAGQAARVTMPDILSENETEVNAMSLTLNTGTARNMIRAYAEAEFDTIKAAVFDDTGAVKQGGMLEEALQPLAAELAAITGVEEAEALAFLIGFVAEKAVGAPEEEVVAGEDLEDVIMSDQPTLSADVQEVVDAAVGKAMQARLPDEPRGGSQVKIVDKTKNINLIFPRSRHEIKTISSMGDLMYALAYHRHDLLNDHRIKTMRSYKALGINPDSAGGYLTPIEDTAEVIELLRDTTKVLPLCRQVTMSSDTREVSKQTGGATANWIGENAQITESQQTYGQIRLVAKKLAGRVIISNELMTDSDPDIEAEVRNDLAAVMALEVDRAILEGSGVGNEPTGLLNLGVTQTVLNAAPTTADLQNAISRVEVEDVLENPIWTWVFNPREKSTLRLLQDARGGAVGTGAYIFSEMGADFGLQGKIPPNLLGYPWTTTTQITIDTDDNNETEMYFGQWNDVIVGMRKTLELAVSQEAGTLWENDQTGIRAIMRLDVNIRHAQSIEVLTDVRAS